MRPTGWECPWCGPSGLPFDLTLPSHLRLCDECHRAAAMLEEEIAASWTRYHAEREEKARDEARACYRPLLDRAWVTFFGPRWPFFEFAKAWMMNSILGAMEAAGLDRRAEWAASVERMSPEARACYDQQVSAQSHRKGGRKEFDESP